MRVFLTFRVKVNQLSPKELMFFYCVIMRVHDTMLHCSRCPYFSKASCYLNTVTTVDFLIPSFHGPIVFYDFINIIAPVCYCNVFFRRSFRKHVIKINLVNNKFKLYLRHISSGEESLHFVEWDTKSVYK